MTFSLDDTAIGIVRPFEVKVLNAPEKDDLIRNLRAKSGLLDENSTRAGFFGSDMSSGGTKILGVQWLVNARTVRYPVSPQSEKLIPTIRPEFANIFDLETYARTGWIFVNLRGELQDSSALLDQYFSAGGIKAMSAKPLFHATIPFIQDILLRLYSWTPGISQVSSIKIEGKVYEHKIQYTHPDLRRNPEVRDEIDRRLEKGDHIDFLSVRSPRNLPFSKSPPTIKVYDNGRLYVYAKANLSDLRYLTSFTNELKDLGQKAVAKGVKSIHTVEHELPDFFQQMSES
jgi:hypothetical protein